MSLNSRVSVNTRVASSSSRAREFSRTAKHLVDAYFTGLGWKPFPFQRATWKAHADGRSGLVYSATGTGKTLAVWLGPILRWLRENPDPKEWEPKAPPTCRVLWITPLRALAGDTEQAMRGPLETLGLPWTLERRTGDSSASAKARQLKRLPTALITTPESLSLLLTHAKLLEQLSGIQTVIVDEWHELLGTKRGIQTELGLARLRKLNPKMQTWGVSATLGSLETARDVLLGPATESGPASEPMLIEGYKKHRIQFESLIPREIERFPWSGHVGSKMVPQVAELIEQVTSTLVFANTRSQTEIWYQSLLKRRPDWAGQIAVHHGSLDTSVRNWVENGLRESRLKAVVCTSSLDLGVDFTAVDLVVQVGSPKGAARLLQRAGRSGHRPDAISRLAFVPTNLLELIEMAAAKDSIRGGKLESRVLLSKPLDVLAQHLVSVAIGGGFEDRAMLAEVRESFAYRNLSEEEWKWVLQFLQFGGAALTAYPEFHRVQLIDGLFQVVDRKTIRNHRMNIGTIVSDAAMKVKYLKGTTLGTVEEYFVSKLKPDDQFLFAGRLVKLVRVHDNTAYVRRATGKPNAVPRWMGGRLPLSSELSDALRTKLEEASRGDLRSPEMKALRPIFALQERWSLLPERDEFLIELLKTRTGHQAFFFPFEGRLVHEGLAALFAHRMSKLESISFSMACNDYGFVLQSAKPIPAEKALGKGLLDIDSLKDDILASMNATEMSKRQFRQIARVAGLVQGGYLGARKSAKHLQASSNLFYEVFMQYDADNPLLTQSRQEVLEQQLEATRMQVALERLSKCRIRIERPPQVTPLAFPLLVDKLRERLSSEALADRIARLTQQLEKAADR